MSLVQKKAPAFKADAVLKGGEFKQINLEDYKGKWVVLFFYPLDFTFVCPTEITAFSDQYADFQRLGAEVLACSVDSKFSHLAWIQTPRSKGGLGDINFPILSDLSKTIARDYEVLINDAIALRGLFIIDPNGSIRYELVHDLGIGRNVDEVLRTLEAIQTVDKTGEVCPAGWIKGKETMKPDPKGSQAYFNKAG